MNIQCISKRQTTTESKIGVPKMMTCGSRLKHPLKDATPCLGIVGFVVVSWGSSDLGYSDAAKYDTDSLQPNLSRFNQHACGFWPEDLSIQTMGAAQLYTC